MRYCILTLISVLWFRWVDTSATTAETPVQPTPSSSAAETPAGENVTLNLGLAPPSNDGVQRREVSPIRKGRFSVVTHKPDEVEEITTGVIGLEELATTTASIGATMRHPDILQTSQPSMFQHLPNAVAASANSSAPSASSAQLQSNNSNNNYINDAEMAAAAAHHQQHQEYLQRRFSQGLIATIPGQSFHGAPVFVTTGPTIQVRFRLCVNNNVFIHFTEF